MGAEGPGNVARVESIGHKHRAADHQGRDTVLGSAHVKHRGPGDKAVVCVDIKIRAQQRHARDQGALADHGGFSRTAGATGVKLRAESVNAVRPGLRRAVSSKRSKMPSCAAVSMAV